MYELFSYDVFDTIITRKTATPYGIFAIMQDKLLKEEKYQDIPLDIRENFYELRIRGEKFARNSYREKDSEDITIEKIYLGVNNSGLLTQEMMDKMILCEYETELENVLPFEDVINEIKIHMENNERVILISDMYLSSAVIRDMLCVADEIFKEIPIYVSVELGKSKYTGNIYRTLQSIENISYDKWLHTGDNSRSDIENAEKLGIHTVQVHEELLLPIEEKIIKELEDDIAAQMMIGVSKNTRLCNSLSDEQKVGASLGGTLLGSYVKWIINDALSKKIRTLYFIARDGYVLKIIADIFIKEMNLDIKTHYIYGSRKAWRMPSLISDDLDVIELYKSSVLKIITSLKDIANVFDISVSELMQFLPDTIKRSDYVLSRMDVDIIFYYLADSDEFKTYLIKQNKEKNQLVREYLKQEVDLTEDHLAFVELSGCGYTQRCFEKILRSIYNKKISTYYFDLYSKKIDDECEFLDFIPDDFKVKDAIEPLCRAPHGQTQGYKLENGKIIPLLELGEEELYYESGYDKYVDGLIAYAQTYVKYYNEYFRKSSKIKVVMKYWDYYVGVNDNQIWEFVGAVPFALEGDNNKKITYAPKLTRDEIEQIFVGKNMENAEKSYYGACLQMSMLRMSEEERAFVRKCQEDYKDLPKLEAMRLSENSVFGRIPDNKVNGKRIILYGGGRLGKIFYSASHKTNDFEVLLWVDRQFNMLKKAGFPISNPDEMINMNADIILISVVDKKVMQSIKNDLIKMGVPKEKIEWISPREMLETFQD